MWQATLPRSTSSSKSVFVFRRLAKLVLLNLAICAGCAKKTEPLTLAKQQEDPAKMQATPSPDPTPPINPIQAQPINKSWPNAFAFVTRTIVETHDGFCPYEISAEYPRIEGIRLPSTIQFNRWIKKKVLGDVARFRNLELRAEPRARKEGRRLITEGLELTHRVYYSNRQIISIRLTHRVMAAGQMHPINYYETINYDLKNNRQLREKDVFRRGYLKVFSSFARKELIEKYGLGLDWWVTKGTLPRHYNFASWNIVPDGILLSFEDYQVSSHSFGQPEFIVPYSVLKKMLLVRAVRRLVRA